MPVIEIKQSYENKDDLDRDDYSIQTKILIFLNKSLLISEGKGVELIYVYCLKEARALLGRYEYQKGNIEAALHVFEGIDITAVTNKIMASIARKGDRPRRRSQNFTTPPMSMHAVGLLFEAIFLKAKSLQGLVRFGGTVY